MHATSGRWKLGLLLALVTAVFWGLLPIALKLLLAALDAYTITWYRFAVSGVALGAWLAWRRRLPRPGSLGGRGLLLLAAALAGLVGNYVLYLFSLELTSPTAAQVLIQLAPIFLLFGGLVVFRERFAPLQWLGFFVLVAGLLLFFHDRGPEILRLGSAFGIGIALMVAAALSWAAYGLAQKQLLTRLGSGQILLLLYLGATPVLLLPADLGAVRGLDGLQLGLLAFCCANTVVAYGCFAEALEHWEVSRVSAVVTLAPLVTFAAMHLVARLWPAVAPPERLDGWSVAGTLLVVAGSMACALGARRGSASAPTEG